MRRLILGFAGRTYLFVGNLMSRLNYVHVISESCVELGLLYSLSIANHSHSTEWTDLWKFTFKTIALPRHNRLTRLNQWYIQLTLPGPETPKRIRWQISRDMRFSKNVVCATSKGSDKPAHTRSLIRAFASRLNIIWLSSYWPNSIWSF